MQQQAVKKVLRIDSSVGGPGSLTREVGDEVVRRLAGLHPGLEVTTVDLADGIGHIDAAWVEASFTPPGQRSPLQRARLSGSNAAVEALREADAVVLTVPLYNFAIPSALKAWLDQVCRPGLTFRYTEKGPEGLLRDRPVYLVMVTGGVPVGSGADFASGHLRQVFRFLGIEDVRLIAAEGVARDPDAARRAAGEAVAEWFAQDAAVA